MNFGQALAALLNGRAITRSGWLRPNMQIGLQPAIGKITQPFLYQQIANGECVVWTPDQADILSVDWVLAGGETGQETKQAERQPAAVPA